jgi:hypothetical protein
MKEAKALKPRKLREAERRKNLRALVMRVSKLKPKRGKKWISQEHHDQVLYGH